MKKTTTIHLSGILFHIEEDAFNTLHQYLQSIENHFSQNNSKKEIIEDIENRIAELLSEKLKNNKQVITIEDIQEVISIMGKVEDFESDEKTETSDNNENYNIRKRFYRNPDDKIIGGVCGGIAAYFDIDPLWIRLAWAILFFIFGSGFLFYLLLWIIIPEAKTPSQKLEMRGEKINISNISKGMSDDLKNFGERTSKEFSKLSGNKLITFVQNIIQYILNFIYGTGKVLMKIVAIFFILLFVFILIVLIGTLFEESYVAIDTKSFLTTATLSDFFINPFKSILFSISVFLLIGVPLLYLIGGLIKFIFNIKRKIKYTGIVALILWIFGWGLLIYSIVDIGKNFSSKSHHTTQIAQYLQPNKTIYIKMKEDENYLDEDDFKIRINSKILYSDNKNNVNIGFPSVFVKKSKDDSLRIKIISLAFAENNKQAKIYAKNISYEISLNDTILELASKYDIPKEDKFHFQKIKVIIEIPQNRYVYFSKNMKYYLSEAENNVDADEDDMIGKRWLMGIDQLQCIEQCDEIQNISTTHHKHKKHHKKESESEYEDTEE